MAHFICFEFRLGFSQFLCLSGEFVLWSSSLMHFSSDSKHSTVQILLYYFYGIKCSVSYKTWGIRGSPYCWTCLSGTVVAYGVLWSILADFLTLDFAHWLTVTHPHRKCVKGTVKLHICVKMGVVFGDVFLILFKTFVWIRALNSCCEWCTKILISLKGLAPSICRTKYVIMGLFSCPEVHTLGRRACKIVFPPLSFGNHIFNYWNLCGLEDCISFCSLSVLISLTVWENQKKGGGEDMSAHSLAPRGHWSPPPSDPEGLTN